MSPCLLAIDTSTEVLALALCAPGVERLLQLPGGAQASAALLPAVHRLLADAGLTLRKMQAVAFGTGPGAFTGLRTSCAVAQGLAFGLGCPVLPLDSLMLVADDARAQQPAADDIVVLMDARMGEAYAGRYRWRESRWQVLQRPALCTPAALPAFWAPLPDALAGSALAVSALGLQLPPDRALLPAEHSRPAALLRLARRAWADGAAVDAAAALPLYLRDKVALTTRERDAVRAAASR